MKQDHPARTGTPNTHSSHPYGARYGTEPIPKYSIPSKVCLKGLERVINSEQSAVLQGTDAQAAYQLIHDELTLDGSPLLNLASFVHTWMPEQANKLMIESMSKNLIDQDEYPMTRVFHKFYMILLTNLKYGPEIIHTRCISMLANLWHAPKASSAIGTATTGSSEAIQLGGLAMKRMWQERRKSQGKSIHEPGPNIVMGKSVCPCR